MTNWGRRQDWEKIVREHGPMVFTTAWRILGQAADHLGQRPLGHRADGVGRERGHRVADDHDR